MPVNNDCGAIGGGQWVRFRCMNTVRQFVAGDLLARGLVQWERSVMLPYLKQVIETTNVRLHD